MNKVPLILLLSFALFVAAVFLFLFVGSAPAAQEISWGVNFSQKQAEALNLDWREVYEAALTDLGARSLRVSVHWDMAEPVRNEFVFQDVDWMMEKAGEAEAHVILAIGMKTPRWPECHIPDWAEGLSREQQQEEIEELLSAFVSRYRDHKALESWQVENEPLFSFGECPWADPAFLKKEISLVQSLDSGHDVFTTDSGELSLWWRAAALGDKVGVTLYRKAFFDPIEQYVEYPVSPVYYGRKAWLIERVFGKRVFVGELQAEPWTPSLLADSSLEEQEQTMSFERFQENIAYAQATGLDTFYFWGLEWWYWMAEAQGDPRFWQEARAIMK